MMGKDTRNLCYNDYCSTKLPIKYYPRIIRTHFAEEICEIFDSINAENAGWMHFGRYINIMTKNPNEPSDSEKLLKEYITYVFDSLSPDPEARIRDFVDKWLSSKYANYTINDIEEMIKEHINMLNLMFYTFDKSAFEKSQISHQEQQDLLYIPIKIRTIGYDSNLLYSLSYVPKVAADGSALQYIHMNINNNRNAIINDILNANKINPEGYLNCELCITNIEFDTRDISELVGAHDVDDKEETENE